MLRPAAMPIPTLPGMRLSELVPLLLDCGRCVGLRSSWPQTIILMLLVLLQPASSVLSPQAVHADQQPMRPVNTAFHIILTPLPEPVANLSNPTSLDIRYSLDPCDVRQGETILTIPLEIGNVPTNTSTLEFHDAYGILPVFTQRSEIRNELSWIAMRDCHGILEVNFRCYHRIVNQATPPAGRVDLRLQDGGILGAGASILPLPPSKPSKTYDIIFECDTSKMGAAATCVSSLGPGTEARVFDPISVLANSIFAAGNMTILSPGQVMNEDDGVGNYPFRCIWFDEPPFDAIELCRMGEELYTQLGALFGKPLRQYTLALRRGLDKHGHGGTAFVQASIVEYDAEGNATLAELFPIMAHEMIHNWPLMTELSARHVLDNVLWFTEGIATYYTWLLLFRWNYVTGETAVQQLNEISIAYFTNPHVHWSDRKAQDHFWQDFLAQELPYQRGVIYFLSLNSLIQQHTNGTRSLDDAVQEFAHLRAKNYRHDTSRWIELLGAGFLPPDEAYAGYRHMVEGGVVRPEEGDPLGIGLEMQRTWYPRFELGFDVTSLTTRRVTNLSRSSHAAGAGLREGDQIIAVRDLDASVRNTSKSLAMEVMRGKTAYSVTFLPRSEVAVECYSWVSARR